MKSDHLSPPPHPSNDLICKSYLCTKMRPHVLDIHLLFYLHNILSALFPPGELLLPTLKNQMVLCELPITAPHHSTPLVGSTAGPVLVLQPQPVTGSHMDTWPWSGQSGSSHETFLPGWLDSAPFILWSGTIKMKLTGTRGHVPGPWQKPMLFRTSHPKATFSNPSQGFGIVNKKISLFCLTQNLS